MTTLPARDAFPIAGLRTYLNNARWHPLSTPAMRATQAYLTYKARGPNDGGAPIGVIQERAKAQFAGLINARPAEVSYVPSTMVGENFIVAGLGLPRAGSNVVTDALHFEGSTYMYRSMEAQGLDLRVVRPRDWRITLDDLDRAINRQTRLVAVSLVSYANGFQHDLRAVCELAHSRGAYVYADIIQAAGAVPVDVRATGVDFCACSSYKWLMGDMGLGFLYVRQDLLDTVVRRTQYGHRQYANWADHLFPHQPPGPPAATWDTGTDAGAHFEVGTIANATAACLTYSLEFIHRLGVGEIQRHVQTLTGRLQRELPRLGFEPLTPSETTSPIVAFAVRDCDGAAARLKRANIDVKLDQHVLRVSPSLYNDQHDIDALLTALS